MKHRGYGCGSHSTDRPTKTRKRYDHDHRDNMVAHVKQYYQDHKAERRAYMHLDTVVV